MFIYILLSWLYAGEYSYVTIYGCIVLLYDLHINNSVREFVIKPLPGCTGKQGNLTAKRVCVEPVLRDPWAYANNMQLVFTCLKYRILHNKIVYIYSNGLPPQGLVEAAWRE